MPTPPVITWNDNRYFGSDNMSRGYCPGGEFLIRFSPATDGRSVRLFRDGEYIGSFRIVAAAKRRAVQLIKATAAR